MILWVAERALAARNVARAIVATDDRRILDAVRAEGFEALMTRSDHASGSDRLAEVAATLDDTEVIVNVQGDEPLISPITIEMAVDELTGDDRLLMVTSSEIITEAADVLSPDVVKVVTDGAGNALYFSRSPIPYPRDGVRAHGTLEAALEKDPSLVKQFRKHTGFYAYRRRFLLEYSAWPQSALERAESLEQLRALEHGVMIKVVESPTPSIGVDTMADLERVREIMKAVTSDK
jgi:3-deoxy-manno-octulosonate cytidylyltransferase (CMP-KDO synthetase)